MSTPAVSPVLRALALLQHVLFGVLVLVGMSRALLSGGSPWGVGLAVLVLAGWYAVGVPGVASGIGLAAAPRTAWWLLGLTVVWGASLVVSPEFVWVAFSLWLLAGYLLPLARAVAYTVGVLGIMIAIPALGPGLRSTAEVLGPVIGAVFAVTISRAQRQLLEDDAQRRTLLNSLLRAQSETDALQVELAAAHHHSGVLAERARLSRDIHDGLAQHFTSIVLLARAGQAADPDGRPDLLRQIGASAQAGLDDARRVVDALAPRDLETGSLTAALSRLVGAAGGAGPAIELRVQDDPPPMSSAAQVALLRTAQGALANARAHAAAARVVLTLSHSEDVVRLDVVDDGRGFDPMLVASRDQGDYELGGYGLRSLAARLAEVGGTLDVESAPGEGTALSASVPVGAP